MNGMPAAVITTDPTPVEAGRVAASGLRADLSALLPL
jgi:hypothetical protein